MHTMKQQRQLSNGRKSKLIHPNPRFEPTIPIREKHYMHLSLWPLPTFCRKTFVEHKAVQTLTKTKQIRAFLESHTDQTQQLADVALGRCSGIRVATTCHVLPVTPSARDGLFVSKKMNQKCRATVPLACTIHRTRQLSYIMERNTQIMITSEQIWPRNARI